MNGSRTQMEIHKQTGMNLGNLSTLMKQLSKSQLLSGDLKKQHSRFQFPQTFSTIKRETNE
jgi:DNA-binding transcriptional regulator GbsR (MarR family)